MKPTRVAVAVAAVAVAVLFVGVISPAAEDSEPVSVVSPRAAFDPFANGDPMPSGFRQLLDRDQILPIYHPTFVEPAEVDWPGEMLVIGVAIDGSSKAYPITPLNQREMVIDSLEGIPILVTW